MRVLGEEIIDKWLFYGSLCGQVRKWWRCPHCNQDYVFVFNGSPPWPPLVLPCPRCTRESPLPWPSPRLISWTCEKCGSRQTTFAETWDSKDKTYRRVHWWSGRLDERSESLECAICNHSVAPSWSRPINDVGDGVRRGLWGILSVPLAAVNSSNRDCPYLGHVESRRETSACLNRF
jgi:hypothetical protein